MIELEFTMTHPGGFVLRTALNLPDRGLTAVVGPSGVGKTTFLRCLAGLERPEGRIAVRGDVWQDDAVFLPTYKRRLGYVFQEAGLFPHLSVRGNLEYGARRRKKYQDDIAGSREELWDLLGITHLVDRTIDGLSGGERQRISLARALAARPRLLLLDEPLAAVDRDRKEDILPYLEGLRRLDLPIIYVSHSWEEVARLADQVVALKPGLRAERARTPEELGLRPAKALPAEIRPLERLPDGAAP